MDKTIYKIEGDKQGKTLAVFAGVHGNERAGINALERFVKEGKIDAGIVYCVFANPEAIKRNVREVNQNLNRCFKRNLPMTSDENKRANELMDILDFCDALLDLHSSNSRNSQPFIICGEKGFKYAKFFDFPIVSFGWHRLEPGGADGYMYEHGKVGITLECGSVDDETSGVAIAREGIQIFLQLFGNIVSNTSDLATHVQRRIDVIKCIIKKTDKFSFAKEYADFEKLKENEVYATDGDTTYKANKDEVIIFPRPNKPIGSEAAIIGKNIN